MRLVVLLLLTGCVSVQPAVPPPFEPQTEAGNDAVVDQPNVASEHEDTEPAMVAFARAGSTHDVPRDLLMALAVAETGMQWVVGTEEFEGRPSGVGVMGLRAHVLEHAAMLADVRVESVSRVRRHNILAAAAWLSELADAHGIDRDDLGAWAPVVADWSGIEDEDARAAWVHDEVYAVLQDGFTLEEWNQAGQDVAPDHPEPTPPAGAVGAERSYAVWRGSPNHSSRGVDPGMVIIHSCEGAYSGCWSWLSNSRSGVSAHYVVDTTGSEVSQLVQEDDRAWHIGARYDCDLNGGTDCFRNGASSNDFTIGIEHAGYASQSSWSAGLLDISSQLVCDITRDWDIPADSYHIVSHGRLQPYNRVDPGPNWPWSSYLADIQACRGGGGSTPTPPTTPTGTRVIDSNNAVNDTATAYVEVSGNWGASQNVRGYYNTGYWWRTTGATSDAATFHAWVDTATCYEVQAWWPAASDRSPRAPWVITASDGTRLDTVEVDQTQGGARWNTLGTWTFPEGWNQIALSRWTTPGDVVVADAVRLVPSTCADTPPPAPAPVEIVIDSDQANNGPAAEIDASDAWTATSATAGFHGSDYLFAGTESVSDPADFWFLLEEPAEVTLEARWTAGTNRSDAAPFLVIDPQDNILEVVRVDQTTDHATWVELGTWRLPAGWNRVALSRWGTEGSVVIADAVRVTAP